MRMRIPNKTLTLRIRLLALFRGLTSYHVYCELRHRFINRALFGRALLRSCTTWSFHSNQAAANECPEERTSPNCNRILCDVMVTFSFHFHCHWLLPGCRGNSGSVIALLAQAKQPSACESNVDVSSPQHGVSRWTRPSRRDAGAVGHHFLLQVRRFGDIWRSFVGLCY